MLKPLELFIGLRYLRARRRNRFVSFISLASILGITVGVTALIVVLSVMNGFGNDLRARLVSLTAHVTVTGADGALYDWRSIEQRLTGREGVTGAAPFIENEGMLINGQRLSGAIISGVLPQIEPRVSAIADNMLFGRLESLAAGAHNIILGSQLAATVGAEPGDRVNILIPRPTADGAGVRPTLRRFAVSGVFAAGVQNHDTIRAIVHIEDAAALFDLDTGVTGVRARLEDLMHAPLTARALADDLGPDYVVSDWTEQQASYFRAVKIEKVMMFIILLLIVAVAAFNIVATLVMVVNDKRTDIAILRTLGLSPNDVQRIFLIQGCVIGLFGVLLGVAVGVLLALNVETLVPRIERLFGFSFMPQGVFYSSFIPSDLRWPEVALIALVTFVLAALSTIYPARRAARTEPAEALRYE